MKQPSEQLTATIILHRRANVVQPLIVYLAEVDGQVAAGLTVGERHSVAVTPGRHTVQAKALFWSSPKVEVDVAPEGSLTVEIAPDVRHLWNMIVRRGSFLHVEVGRAAQAAA